MTLDVMSISEISGHSTLLSDLNVILLANPTTVNVLWDPVDDATGYNIEWSEVGSGFGRYDTVAESSTFYTVTDLQSCTFYLISVEAVSEEDQLEIEEHLTQTLGQGKIVISNNNNNVNFPLASRIKNTVFPAIRPHSIVLYIILPLSNLQNRTNNPND